MPEREAARAVRWRLLGRLLPREVRERIYEPAFADLLYRRLAEGRGARMPFGLSALATGLGCLPAILRWGLVRRGRLTGFGRAVLATTASLVLVVLLLRYLTRSYTAY